MACNSRYATNRKATLEQKIEALDRQGEGPVVRRMLQAGASAYLLKGSVSAEVAKAIRTVIVNRTYLSPEITGMVVKQLASDDSAPASPLMPTFLEK